MHVTAGNYQRIYNPSEGESHAWYINDHCIIRGEDGWHLFGITHEEPAQPLEEKCCAHAVADSLQGPYRKLPYPIVTDRAAGEAHFWAPHVIRAGELYYMFWCAGSLEGPERYQINCAVSEDLYTWKRRPENPLVVDGFEARDPMVMRIANRWVMYYTATSAPEGGHHIVCAVTSDDLIHWGDKRTVFTDESIGTGAGPCESPFVLAYEGKYYLLIGPRTSYDSTFVLESEDPFSFTIDRLVGELPAHAAEVIVDDDGTLFTTRCGWGRGGVYLAPLLFTD